MRSLALLILLAAGCSAESATWVAHTPIPVRINSDTFIAFCLISDIDVTQSNAFQWGNGTNVALSARRTVTLYQPGLPLDEILTTGNLSAEYNFTMLNKSSPTMKITDFYAQITVNLVKKDEVGVYSCANRSELDVQSYAHIVLGTGMKASKNVIQGDEYCLKCEAYGWPLPTAIGWYKNGIPVVTDSRVILLDSSNMTANGTIQFNNVEYEDDAEYTCYTWNNFGVSDNATMALRVKDRWAALWPFLGIVAEVIVLCAVILLYEKRQQSKLVVDDEEENTSALVQDGAANNRDERDGVANGDDVRQRPIIKS